MDIPPGWQETKLPPNPDVKKLRTFLGIWYENSGRQDEENFEIQRRGQDRWFLISREAIGQDEIRKAATKGIKLDKISDSAENPRPETRDPNATSQARARPTNPGVTIIASPPPKPDNPRAETAPAGDPTGLHRPLRRTTTMQTVTKAAIDTWSMLKGLVGYRNHTERRINKGGR